MTEKRLTEISAVEGTFLFDGVKYDRNELPPHVQSYCATLDLLRLITQTKKPAKVYADLKSGSRNLGSQRESKRETYSPWHQAAAAAHALVVVKSAGIKAKPGKSVRETPEFEDAYAAALAEFAPWSREKTASAKEMAHVVVEWRRITGAASVSMADVFGAKPAAAEDTVRAGEDAGNVSGELLAAE